MNVLKLTLAAGLFTAVAAVAPAYAGDVCNALGAFGLGDTCNDVSSVVTPIIQGTVDQTVGPQLGGVINSTFAGHGLQDVFRGGQPGPAPVPQPVVQQPGPVWVAPPMQQIAFGNVCMTQFGRSGYGAPAPVGSPCFMYSQMGPVPGYVVQ